MGHVGAFEEEYRVPCEEHWKEHVMHLAVKSKKKRVCSSPCKFPWFVE
jgi:hypothetical protein